MHAEKHGVLKIICPSTSRNKPKCRNNLVLKISRQDILARAKVADKFWQQSNSAKSHRNV